MKRFVVLGLGLFLLATSAVGASAATDGQRGSAACTAAGKDFDPGGRLYTVYCGPATATVHVAGKTMTFRNGTCTWAPSSFKLQLGTIYFSRKPLQTQPGFSIYAAGGATAKALIQVYWQGAYYVASPEYMTARPQAGQAGGSFTGKTGAKGTGPTMTGTVSCS